MSRHGPSRQHKGVKVKSEPSTTVPTCTNSSGLPQYHLRRKHHTGRTKVERFLDFHSIHSSIGWNDKQVGFNVNSSDCCRVIRRQDNNAHLLHGDNVGCLYVDTVAIEGCHILQEGEIVQFGTNTRRQYIFERCRCGLADNHGDDQNKSTKRKIEAVEVVEPKRIKMEVNEPSRDSPVAEKINMATKGFKKEIARLKEAFKAIPSQHGCDITRRWSRELDELDELEKNLQFSKTIIGVVGPTGAGKSGLINAVLGHRILPTSGIGGACTAVVVEVAQNESSDDFEAEVEFLQEKEWFEELRILLEKLTRSDGKLRKRQPSKDSVAYASYCKIMDVYGKIDSLENLRKVESIKDHLGRVYNVSSKDLEIFRTRIAKYIEAHDTQEGSQLWPIVKRVIFRIPQCAVCSSGAVLVDLPGAGDSNAARDQIAAKYLEKCTAVWVVSAIHRAINDKTANDLLRKSLSVGQFYKNGQMGFISFICTKTDDLVTTEIKSKLDVKAKIRPYEQRKDEIKNIIVDLEKRMSDIKFQIVCMEVMELCLETEQHTTRQQLALCNRESDQITAQIMQLQKEDGVMDQNIRAVCAMARNAFVKPAIRRQFRATLKALKGTDENEEEEDDSDYDDEEEEDADADDEIEKTARKLRVFCCSSKEYQNLLTDDVPPQVFTNLADTGIPELRSFVLEMTCIQQEQRLEKLKQGLECLVAGVRSFINDGEDHEDIWEAKNVIDSQILVFERAISDVLRDLRKKLDHLLENLIVHVNEGAQNGKENAESTCNKWGRPLALGGYPCQTYQAIVRRNGRFNSAFGQIDLNAQLLQPMMTLLENPWIKVFCDKGLLKESLSNTRHQTVEKLIKFTSELRGLLDGCGVNTAQSMRVFVQVEDWSKTKLLMMEDGLRDTIKRKQSEIFRWPNLLIEQAMTETYKMCAKVTFKELKKTMLTGVNAERGTMFNKAADAINRGLKDLKEQIMNVMKSTCNELVQNLRGSCKPLCDDTAKRKTTKNALMPYLRKMVATTCKDQK